MGVAQDLQLLEYMSRIADASEKFVKQIGTIKNLRYPLPQPRWPANFVTRQTGKDLTEMGTFIKFETDLHPLPPKEGRNADIAKGVFVVVADGIQVFHTDVQYDLTTREPSGPVAWKAPKGSKVLLRLAYVDDDGNQSAFTDSQFGIVADTIAPDAPTEVGTTRVVEEVNE